ncbi:MAG: hypothetical protein ACK5XN_29500, partial [Bacteroidota bacterium]
MSQSQAIYPAPKHITANYNPLDFYDKNQKKTTTSIVSGLDLAVPKIDKGVTYYDSTTQKLKNNSNFLYTESTGYLFVASRVGINNANPTEALDVVGNIKTNQNISVGGTSTLTGAVTASNNVQINGNLGVGVSPSTNKLDVTGNARITGDLTITGNCEVQGTTAMRNILDMFHISNPIRVQVASPSFPTLSTTGTSTTTARNYVLSLFHNKNDLGKKLGLSFSNNAIWTSVPGASITYNCLTANTSQPDTGCLDFDFTVNSTTGERQNIVSMQPTQVLINKQTLVDGYIQGNSISSLGFLQSYDAT